MKKNGFTLIELLATIIVLAIIGLIVYPTLNNVISGNKEKLYNKQIDELVRHANTWIVGNIEKIGDKNTYKLTFDEMYKYGLIQSSTIKNPKTNQNLQGCMVLVKGESGYTASHSEDCTVTIAKKHCTFDGELVQGAEFVDGPYTYRYKQEVMPMLASIEQGNIGLLNIEESSLGGESRSSEKISDDKLSSGNIIDRTNWVNIDSDGWGVVLTDKESTSPVTDQACSTINGKPIVSMSYMFYESKAEDIDLSGLDTSNVTNMSSMFTESTAYTNGNVNISTFSSEMQTKITTACTSSSLPPISILG